MDGWGCAACGRDNPAPTRFCGWCGAPRAGAGPGEQATRDLLQGFVGDQLAQVLAESGQPRDERRLVTCLFADLSGFTPLADRLDPERLTEVVDPVITRMSAVVGFYDGYVDKYAGDAVLAFFGAPIAREDDVDRALLVALDMRRELAALLPSLPVDAAELTLHIGVNTGHVIARVLGHELRLDYGVLGDAVILAQRLESAAPAGEIYVGEMTAHLAQDRFELEPVGKLTLKGKRDPVPAWRLIGERHTRARRTLSAGALVGREHELRTVLDASHAHHDGGPRLVAIMGEAGAGKSALLAEARRRRARECRWLQLECLSYGAALPYRPFADLVRVQAGPDLDGWCAAHELRDAAPHLRWLLGSDASHDDLAPEGFRRALHDSVAAGLARLAARAPVIIAVEDLHWADPSTLALLAAIAEAPGSPTVITTCRTEARERIAAIAPDGAWVQVPLAPLGEEAVAALVHEVLGGRAAPRLVHELTARGAGNPLFVHELVRSVEAQLELRGGEWVLRPSAEITALAPTLEGLLASRIDALPAAARHVLELAAVLGRRVSLPLLRAIDDAVMMDAGIALLARERLVTVDPVDADTVEFRHPLVQEAAYARLLRRERRELHERAAAAVASVFTPDAAIDLLAYHLARADAGGPAIDALERAGARARALFANTEAADHYGRAAALARETGDPRLADLLVRLGDVDATRGEYASALSSYEEAAALAGDARAWQGVVMSLWQQGRFGEAEKVIAEVAPTLGAAGRSRLRQEEGVMRLMRGEIPAAIAAFSAALEDADDDTRGEASFGRALALSLAGERDAAYREVTAARDLLAAHGDIRSLAKASRVLGGIEDDRGEYAAAEQLLLDALGLAERAGDVQELGACLINLGVVALHLGAHDDAVAYAQRAVAELERVGHAALATACANLAWAYYERGDYDDALVQCDRATALAGELDDDFTRADVLRCRAEIAGARGEHGEGARLARRAAEMFAAMDAPAEAEETWAIAARLAAPDAPEPRPC